MATKIDWSLDDLALRKQLLRLSQSKLIKLCKTHSVYSNGDKNTMIAHLIRNKSQIAILSLSKPNVTRMRKSKSFSKGRHTKRSSMPPKVTKNGKTKHKSKHAYAASISIAQSETLLASLSISNLSRFALPSMASKMTKRWDIHENPGTNLIIKKLEQIGDSIWYSTTDYAGEQGMAEYCLKDKKLKQICKYPENVKVQNHAVCKYKDRVYIIDSYNNKEIIEFDPMASTSQFTRKVKIEYLGYNPSAVVVKDEIHIYNGEKNDKCIALIYNPLKNEVKKITDDFADEGKGNGGIVHYGEKLLRFGGYNSVSEKCMDDFLEGVDDIFIMVHGYVHESEVKVRLSAKIPTAVIDTIVRYYCDIWAKVEDFNLPHPMSGFGYVLYKDYIVTFGGHTGNSCIGNIFILDLKDKDKGWINSKIVCPKRNEYRAILTSDNDVHLFGASTVIHCSMNIESILPESGL